jgi:hypothetical protein
MFSDGVLLTPIFFEGKWQWLVDAFTMDAYTGVEGEDCECMAIVEADTPEGLIPERFVAE